MPPSFFVGSFFFCHGHLWPVLSFFATGIRVHSLSFTAFSAVGIRGRLFLFALSALVGGYQCTSQFLASCSALAARQPSGGPRGQPVSMLCGMDRVMLYNMNVWSRQDRVLKLDRAMLYNMNGQSRQDSVVTTLLAMPTSIV